MSTLFATLSAEGVFETVGIFWDATLEYSWCLDAFSQGRTNKDISSDILHVGATNPWLCCLWKQWVFEGLSLGGEGGKINQRQREGCWRSGFWGTEGGSSVSGKTDYVRGNFI